MLTLMFIAFIFIFVYLHYAKSAMEMRDAMRPPRYYASIHIVLFHHFDERDFLFE